MVTTEATKFDHSDSSAVMGSESLVHFNGKTYDCDDPSSVKMFNTDVAKLKNDTSADIDMGGVKYPTTSLDGQNEIIKAELMMQGATETQAINAVKAMRQPESQGFWAKLFSPKAKGSEQNHAPASETRTNTTSVVKENSENSAQNGETSSLIVKNTQTTEKSGKTSESSSKSSSDAKSKDSSPAKSSTKTSDQKSKTGTGSKPKAPNKGSDSKMKASKTTKPQASAKGKPSAGDRVNVSK